jgi:hypothetical protein
MGIRSIKSLACGALLAALVTLPAAASPRLSERAATHALRADLARSYGIHHVHASCRRKGSARFACGWRGRRSDGAYRGRATVSRSSGSTSVSLSDVRRA